MVFIPSELYAWRVKFISYNMTIVFQKLQKKIFPVSRSRLSTHFYGTNIYIFLALWAQKQFCFSDYFSLFCLNDEYFPPQCFWHFYAMFSHSPEYMFNKLFN